ncbi:hypothetical protein BB559_001996 [Furculomyces boomerangus]|uniref:Uncharacterized protein n=2 Tax=Harpellales TaxID=61421 RepID=A0A2T9YZ19_9FUNG|nr:hypothetical protein BB559_001996 [Furculomyces boomerangus]
MFAKTSKNMVEDEEGNFVIKNTSTDRKKAALASSAFGINITEDVDSQFFTDKSNLEPIIKGKMVPVSRPTYGARVDDMGNPLPYISGVELAVIEAERVNDIKNAGGPGGKKHKKGKKNIKSRSGSVYQ